MAYCKICGKYGEDDELLRGIDENSIIDVCKDCADNSGIPLIKKPTNEQLNTADKHYSVRERMERLSGLAKKKELTQNQLAASRSLARLRMPPKKQYDPKLIDNYDWKLRMARRRKKITISQLATQTGVSLQALENYEAGQVEGNFEEDFEKLEKYFDTKFLSANRQKIHFTRQHGDAEKKVLAEVEVRMKSPISEAKEKEERQEKEEKISQLSKGELDLSKRKNLDNITLKDLQEMQRRKKIAQEKTVEKRQHDSMFGEDLDIEEL